MSRRVRSILLVSSLYDSYTLEEDGRFTEVLFSEYLSLNLRYAPRVKRVSTAEEALEAVRDDSFDLVITMVRVGSMPLVRFCTSLKEIREDIPVVLLTYTARDLEVLRSDGRLEGVDKAFTWQGDVRLFLAIVKLVEDMMNVRHDAEAAGVKSIILVEDSVRFCSSYIPMLYLELMAQTQKLMTEGLNKMHRLMRMRARPKVLHVETYEEAAELFDCIYPHVLGVITDSRFQREGTEDPMAGFALAEIIRARDPELPILFQSSEEDLRTKAWEMGAAFIDKGSPTLLAEVRQFMRDYLGFGDFVFRAPDGEVEATANDLRSLHRAVRRVSDECLLAHARRNDFSTWLMARTEFDLAKAIRPQKVEDFDSVDGLREYLLASLKLWRDKYRAGQVEEFDRESFETGSEFVKIGSGSLGGKGRGLAFMHALLGLYTIGEDIPGAEIFVPPTAVVATDVFDRFLEAGGLRELVFGNELDDLDGLERDRAVAGAFTRAELPGDVVEMLGAFLEKVDYPLAVRSSSLLEDSPAQPFAGIYNTYMIPNNHPDREVRLMQLCHAVKLVMASTFYSEPVAYMETTPNRLEEEKMAVVIQQVVGREHGDAFYPNFAGVAKSYNHYPVKGLQAEDGIASVALGLGGTVVEGGKCVRFSPASPQKLFQFSSTDDYLRNSQRELMALSLESPGSATPDDPGEDVNMVSLGLERARDDGTLQPVGSVYVPDNDLIVDGTFREGPKLVTMAGVLKGDVFPLAEVLGHLLAVGRAAFSCEVEMEFAVNLDDGGDRKGELGFLQIRPMGVAAGGEVDIDDVDLDGALCVSRSVLGTGSIEDVRDILYVSPARFSRNDSANVTGELEKLNRKLRSDGRSSLLIGPGRWGSSDSWLGIPVKWNQISSARCIVELPLDGISVEPSQGTHFFQNITSLGIGYFTLSGRDDETLDSGWLEEAPSVTETEHVRHVRLEEPLSILIDRKAGTGAILRGEPDAG